MNWLTRRRRKASELEAARARGTQDHVLLVCVVAGPWCKARDDVERLLNTNSALLVGGINNFQYQCRELRCRINRLACWFQRMITRAKEMRLGILSRMLVGY